VFHTVAYSATSGAAAFTDQDMTLVSDPSVTNLNGHPIFPVPTWIQWASVHGTTVTRARISAPRLRPITRPVLAPVDNSVFNFDVFPGVEWFRHPIQLNPVEEIQVLVTKTSAVAETDVAVLTVGDNQRNVPQGDMYILRMTSTNGVVALTWQPAANTPDDTLQVGRYSIIGLRVVNASGGAARLIFPGAPVSGGLPQIRPGVLMCQTDARLSSWIFRYGTQGEFGQFESFALPQTEVVSSVAPAASTETFFDIVDVRVGARAQ
jgi:hypothetical protein